MSSAPLCIKVQPPCQSSLLLLQVANNTVHSNRGRGAVLKSSNGVILGNSFVNNKLTGVLVQPDFQFLEVRHHFACSFPASSSDLSQNSMHAINRLTRSVPCTLAALLTQPSGPKDCIWCRGTL